jgi:hypothetical protein
MRIFFWFLVVLVGTLLGHSEARDCQTDADCASSSSKGQCKCLEQVLGGKTCEHPDEDSADPEELDC